ncbi:MAG TPA: hypothetical protein VEJ38_06675 [Candidatus Acidoferrales bacterium]|nr:hypothetical protein [Candidatus Acidoferrales bacterium]
MKKLAVFFGLFALLALPATAQDQAPTEQNQAPSDQGGTSSQETHPVKVKKTYVTPKFEISAGYSHRTYYSPNGPEVGVPGGIGMNGWYVSFDDNLIRWVGIAGEFADTGKNQGLLLGDTHIYTFVVGPQIYPLGHRKLTPFGHFFFGGGYYRDDISRFSEFGPNSITSLVEVWEAGGGLDLNLSEHWGVRLIEFNVGSANYFPNTQSFTNSTSKRVSVGVVYRFGHR